MGNLFLYCFLVLFCIDIHLVVNKFAIGDKEGSASPPARVGQTELEAQHSTLLRK